MNKKYRFLYLMLMASVLSCSKVVEQRGVVNFSIDSDYGIVDVVKSSVSDYTSLPSASSFNIEIVRDDDTPVWSGVLSSWDNTTPLVAGDYSVKASFTDGKEGFDKPSFQGEKKFTVVGENSTDVLVPVSLQNCLVRVSCTDNFRNYYPHYSFVLTTAEGMEIVFDENETRAAFIDAYKFSVSGSLVNQGGVKSSFAAKEYEGLEAATCYTLRFDTSGTGGMKISISFNDEVNVVDLGFVELN